MSYTIKLRMQVMSPFRSQACVIEVPSEALQPLRAILDGVFGPGGIGPGCVDPFPGHPGLKGFWEVVTDE